MLILGYVEQCFWLFVKGCFCLSPKFVTLQQELLMRVAYRPFVLAYVPIVMVGKKKNFWIFLPTSLLVVFHYT